MKDKGQIRKEIYEDTVEMTEQFDRKSATRKRGFNNNLRNDPFGATDISVIGSVTGSFPKANIIVENSDTVSSLQRWNQTGKTCLLNMASYKHAGGGVRNGAQAQEECLFRCSNLWETITQGFYPLNDNEALYTNDSIFFKDKDYGMIEPITCDVVTVAAVNLNRNSYFDIEKNDYVNGLVEKDDNYTELTKKKIRLMLSLALKSKVDNIILGAWGCGVFKNDPSEMATMFREVLVKENFGGQFKNVIFAIINDENSHGDNFDVFNTILK